MFTGYLSEQGGGELATPADANLLDVEARMLAIELGLREERLARNRYHPASPIDGISETEQIISTDMHRACFD